MTDLYPNSETRVLPTTPMVDADNRVLEPDEAESESSSASGGYVSGAVDDKRRPLFAAREWSPPKGTLVVVVGMIAIAVAFIIMLFVGVTPAGINALAVVATPIAILVAAYYGLTLSIQQVRSERVEKEKAIQRAEAADAASRESEVWAAQLEAGLRVAMVKLTAAGISTNEVSKAAGTPDDFF